jgi:hypothetical protein
MEDRKNTNRENLVQSDLGKGDRKASRKLEKGENLVRYIYREVSTGTYCMRITEPSGGGGDDDDDDDDGDYDDEGNEDYYEYDDYDDDEGNE